MGSGIPRSTEIFIKVCRTPANNMINLTSPETRVYAEHFLLPTVWVYLYSFLCNCF